jgi:transmembrane sensor
MNAPTPTPGAGHVGARLDSAESLELADYLASQNPLDVEAALWLARKQDGLAPGEAAELHEWLAGDPARSAKLDQLSGLRELLDGLPPDHIAALKAAVSPLATPVLTTAPSPAPRASAQETPAPATVRRPDRREWLLGWGRLAPQAAFAGLVAMAVGSGWLGWGHWQRQPIFTQSFATARGQQLAATLPEGSRVHLDTATSLDVALYRQRREVRLPQGQALFDVKPDPERPFHVLAGSLRITVLGTRFSVRHTQNGLDAGRVSVVVLEGHVRVARTSADGAQAGAGQEFTATGAEFVELTAGQSVMADAQGSLAAVAANTPGTALAWRDGRVVLNDVPLGDALAEFERYVDTGLSIRDPVVAALRLNGSFDLRQLQAFKRALPQALPVRLVMSADGKTEIVPAP